MSNPVLESFCCALKYHANQSIVDGDVLRARGVSLAYDVLCLIAAVLGIAGCLYQLYPRAPRLHPRQPAKLAGYLRQNYVVTWLAVADLLAASGILVRSVLWLSGVFKANPTPQAPHSLNPDTAHVICALLSVWIQYFYVCTYMWTFCYAIDVCLYVTGRPSVPALYQMIGWQVSLVLCIVGTIPLYYPSLVRCDWGVANSLPHYLAWYIPMLLVMFGNPVLFKVATLQIRGSLRAQGRYTDTERKVVMGVQSKFLRITIAFYLCWTPNLVNGLLLLCRSHVTRDALATCWMIMAVLNPLQGFFNALLFHHVGGAYCYVTHWLRHNPRAFYRPMDDSQETSPLLSFRRDEL